MTPEELAEIVAAVKADLAAASPSPLAVGGFFQVAPGQTILADHMNTALVNGVPKFANATARDTQWPSPPPGAVCFLLDSNYFQIFTDTITGFGTSWRVVGSLRMGYGQMGSSQAIPHNAHTGLKISTVGGAANQAGRATWTVGLDYVTVPLSGTYLVVGDVTWPSNATGQRLLELQRYTAGAWGNSGVSGGVDELNSPTGASPLRRTTTAIMSVGAGERIRSAVYQDSGTTLTLPAVSSDTASLVIQFLGAD